VHEASEYVLGAGLVVVGAHVSGLMSPVLYGSGAAWCLLGILSKGRLGIFRLVGRRAHAVLDLFLVAALALSPLVLRHRLDWFGVGVGEAVAVVLARISFWTIYRPGLVPARPLPASPGTRGSSELSGSSGEPVPAGTAAAEERSRVASLARSAGRGAGAARKGAAVVGPQVRPVVTKGAHRLGRTIGAARRARAARSTEPRQPD
jgi:hypothetical protein